MGCRRRVIALWMPQGGHLGIGNHVEVSAPPILTLSTIFLLALTRMMQYLVQLYKFTLFIISSSVTFSRCAILAYHFDRMTTFFTGFFRRSAASAAPPLVLHHSSRDRAPPLFLSAICFTVGFVDDQHHLVDIRRRPLLLWVVASWRRCSSGRYSRSHRCQK
ncbi:hypothetical protein EVAR_31363_1 [Eumeta japonica]|uniref:Uncharacterized protein n=1 Tax=Eumeta variegata TaxID=151549 RepID=A0A4C1XAX9_EUMVA|nr:hypothetical protein EVAR_31363_1 [Eumeta japonica]